MKEFKKLFIEEKDLNLIPTQIHIYPLPDKENQTGLRAYVRIILNDSFQLTGLKIYENQPEKFTLIFPRNNPNGSYDCKITDIVTRAKIETAVIKQYINEPNEISAFNGGKSFASNMKITSFKIHGIQDQKGKLRAFCSIVLNHELELHHLRIYSGSVDVFVSYPVELNKENEFRQLFYPLTRSLRDQIQFLLIEKYYEIIRS